MSRPLLVGLHNPLSSEPEFALYPLPEGSTGGRIVELLEPAFTRRQYMRAFDRVNLLRHDEQIGGAMYALRLRSAGRALLNYTIIDHKLVVLFGADVWAAILGPHGRDKSPPWTLWTFMRLTDDAKLTGFLTLPHPSGRNRWYNKPTNRAAAASALRHLATSSLRTQKFEQLAAAARRESA